jgi:hypothetical protein
MYPQPTSVASRPTTDYRIVDGLVDVLTDLFDANESELPRSLHLAHAWLRKFSSQGDRLGRCDDELIEALADIAAEAHLPHHRFIEDPFSLDGVRLTSSLER